MDNLCYRCKHKTGPLTCGQVARGLTPGWPRAGGTLPSGTQCPRFDNAPPWPDYMGNLSDLGLKIDAERVTGHR